MLILATVVIFGGRNQKHSSGSAAPRGVLGPGAGAPDVALPATSGQTIDLASFRGKRNVLLYFYEHAG